MHNRPFPSTLGELHHKANIGEGEMEDDITGWLYMFYISASHDNISAGTPVGQGLLVVSVNDVCNI